MNSTTDDPSFNGAAWAALVAATGGCACFGILVDLAEAFKPVSRGLSFYAPTGDLSGKSTLAVVAWLVLWAVLHACWKGRNIERPGRLAVIAVVLIIIALVATFPPFFGMFEAK